MKKILAIIISLVLVFSCMTVSATAFEVSEASSTTSPFSNGASFLINVIETLWTQINSFLQDVTRYIKDIIGSSSKPIEPEEPIIEPEEPDVEPDVPTIEPDITPLPELIAKSDSVVIDRQGKTVNDYTPDCEWYVYGFEEYLTEDMLLDKYIDVEGDGRIEIIPVDVNFGPYRGTGTIINIYDRHETLDDTTDDTLVESFRIIIFGDINGDTIIRAVDSTLVDREVAGYTNWSKRFNEDNASNPEYVGYYVMATDLDKDGLITSVDASNIDHKILSLAEIDQTTGTIKPYPVR